MKSKRKPQTINEYGLGEVKPRRSIPVAEVDEMLARQAKRLTKESTPYDQRLELLEKLEDLAGSLAYHQDSVREFNLRIFSIKKDLDTLNRTITTELELDPLR